MRPSPDGARAPVVRVLTPVCPSGLGLTGLGGRGELISNIARRDVKLRYAQTRLGPVWVLLQPLIPAVLFTFVFNRVVRVDTGGVPYLVSVTAALTPWTFVSRAVNRGGSLLLAERALVTRVYFPRLVNQVAAVLSLVVDFVVSLVVVALAMLVSGYAPTWHVVTVPVLMAWTMAFSIGTSCLVAAASVKRRDAIQILPIATQGWLFLSPVAYPMTNVESFRWLIVANPMTSIVEAFRWALVGQWSLSRVEFAVSTLIGLACIVVGLFVFHRADWKLADVL